MEPFEKIRTTFVAIHSRYVVCYSWNASVSIDRLSRHLGLDLLGHVRNLFYMLLLKKCVPSACIAISVLISFPKIVLVLNNSDFHMSPYKHTAVNLFPQTNLNICHCFMIFLKKKLKIQIVHLFLLFRWHTIWIIILTFGVLILLRSAIMNEKCIDLMILSKIFEDKKFTLNNNSHN